MFVPMLLSLIAAFQPQIKGPAAAAASTKPTVSKAESAASGKPAPASPSRAAMRDELHQQLRDALDAMDPVDREVLALRHFEEMTNAEVAEALGITKDAASKRHIRALVRLREILGDGG